ncbi:MAG TPA: GNAT family N-acetyltransferase [Longimicrobium sp.]
MSDALVLREMTEDDLPVLFEYQLQPAARHMAAFTPKDSEDREAYLARWKKIIASDTTLPMTVLLDGQVVGMIGGFERDGEPEVTYWIGEEHWGKGIATRGLSRFLERYGKRPLYARVVKDNAASIRVLEKCGFVACGEDRGFANARGEEVDEVVYRLG